MWPRWRKLWTPWWRLFTKGLGQVLQAQVSWVPRSCVPTMPLHEGAGYPDMSAARHDLLQQVLLPGTTRLQKLRAQCMTTAAPPALCGPP